MCSQCSTKLSGRSRNMFKRYFGSSNIVVYLQEGVFITSEPSNISTSIQFYKRNCFWGEMNTEINLNLISHVHQIFFGIVLLFNCIDKPSQNFWLPLTTLVFAIPLTVYLVYFINAPASKIRANEIEMLRTVNDSNFSRKQRVQLIIQIHNQPMKLTLFNYVNLDSAVLSYLFTQVAMWLFTLLQYELDSLK